MRLREPETAVQHQPETERQHQEGLIKDTPWVRRQRSGWHCWAGCCSRKRITAANAQQWPLHDCLRCLGVRYLRRTAGVRYLVYDSVPKTDRTAGNLVYDSVT